MTASAAVVMVSGTVVCWAVTVRVRNAVAVSGGLLASVTWNVSGAGVTPAVGVPLITPVEAPRVRPAGISRRARSRARRIVRSAENAAVHLRRDTTEVGRSIPDGMFVAEVLARRKRHDSCH